MSQTSIIDPAPFATEPDARRACRRGSLRIAEQGEQGDHRNYDRDQAAIFPSTAP